MSLKSQKKSAGFYTGSVILLVFLLLLPSSLPAAWMGIQIKDHSSTNDPQKGVQIVSVGDLTPAQKAGLRKGDIILSINGGHVYHANSIIDVAKSAAAGDSLDLKLWREGSILRKVLVLEEMPLYMSYYHKGRAANVNGNYEEAVSHYTKAIELNPGWASAYDHRAYTYFLQKRYDKAIADSTKAIKLEPSPHYYLIRANTYREKGDYDKAIVDYNKALSIDPSQPRAYFSRALAFKKQGRHEAAVSDLTHAVQLNPSYAEAYHNRAAIYKDKGRQAAAKEDYDRAAKEYMNNGLDYSREGKYDDAIKKYSEGIRLNTKYSSPLYYNRGIAYEKKGDYSRAIEDYNQAIALNPDFSRAYLRRGFVYAQKLQQYDKAEQDWKKATGLDPDGKTGRSARKNLEKIRNMR